MIFFISPVFRFMPRISKRRVVLVNKLSFAPSRFLFLVLWCCGTFKAYSDVGRRLIRIKDEAACILQILRHSHDHALISIRRFHGSGLAIGQKRVEV